MEMHTVLDSAIERKNHYQGRMAENMANIIYFTKRKAALVADRDKLKIDTEARAELNKQIASADSAILNGKANIDADQMLMESFSELIEDLKKEVAPKKPKK